MQKKLKTGSKWNNKTEFKVQINGTGGYYVQDAFHLNPGNPNGHVWPPRVSRSGKRETLDNCMQPVEYKIQTAARYLRITEWKTQILFTARISRYQP